MGSGGIAAPFLTSALDGGEWSDSRSCRFTPEERAPDTHWIGGWVSPRAGLNAVEKRKVFNIVILNCEYKTVFKKQVD
jgi:hypothetical protein